MGMTRTQLLAQAAQLDERYGADASVIVHDFGNGYTIRCLARYGDVCREGVLMSNCWSREFWKAEGRLVPETYEVQCNHVDAANQNYVHMSRKKGEGNKLRNEGHRLYLKRNPSYKKRIDPHFYSLRDSDNLPHASFFLNGHGRPIRVGARHNGELAAKYHRMVHSWELTPAGVLIPA